MSQPCENQSQPGWAAVRFFRPGRPAGQISGFPHVARCDFFPFWLLVLDLVLNLRLWLVTGLMQLRGSLYTSRGFTYTLDRARGLESVGQSRSRAPTIHCCPSLSRNVTLGRPLACATGRGSSGKMGIPLVNPLDRHRYCFGQPEGKLGRIWWTEPFAFPAGFQWDDH